MTSTEQATGATVAAIGAGETLRAAGHRMRELGVTTLAVRGADGELHGVISSDMLVQRIAAGGDPKTVTVGEVAAARLPRSPAGPWGATGPGPAWLWAERGIPGDTGPLEDAPSPPARDTHGLVALSARGQTAALATLSARGQAAALAA